MGPLLRCPHCHAPLERVDGAWGCAAGHRFDVASQGYVTLLAAATPHDGDTAAMLDARTRVLEAGHLDAVTDAVVDALRGAPAGCLVEVGAGTGHHLRRVAAAVGRPGVALDVSTPAVRRAARAAPDDVLVVRADAWAPWPVADGVAAGVLTVFGPRNLPEAARVLVPGGRLVVVTPRPDHLAELVGPLGMLAVAPDKAAHLRTEATLLAHVTTTRVQDRRRVDRTTAVDLALMGPTGHHATEEELAGRAEALPDQLDVTVDVDVSVFTPV